MNRPTMRVTFSEDDADWRRQTEVANVIYHGGRTHEALVGYKKAFEEAERLFTNAERGVALSSAAAIYVISCFNLSEVSRATEGSQAAETWLLRAFDRLVDAADSDGTPLPLRLDCMRDLKFAYLNLVELRRNDAAFQDEMVRHRERAMAVAAKVFGAVDRLTQIPPDVQLLMQAPQGRPC
jgi:hypothetical protein